MKQTEARALFPKHTLRFGEAMTTVYEKGTSNVVASVSMEEDKSVVCVMHVGSIKNPGAPSKITVPRFIAIAEISSYRNVYEVEKALNAERAHDCLEPVPHTMAKMKFREVQNQDYDFAIRMLATFIAVQTDDSHGFTREQFNFLTTNGKSLYRGKIKEQEARQEAPTTSPVAQVAQTIAKGKQKRADADKRTVWNEEDDAIFALVEHDHKVLSDRLAALHSARGSKISIPEFDRRRKAQKEAEQNG